MNAKFPQKFVLYQLHFFFNETHFFLQAIQSVINTFIFLSRAIKASLENFFFILSIANFYDLRFFFFHQNLCEFQRKLVLNKKVLFHYWLQQVDDTFDWINFEIVLILEKIVNVFDVSDFFLDFMWHSFIGEKEFEVDGLLVLIFGHFHEQR